MNSSTDPTSTTRRVDEPSPREVEQARSDDGRHPAKNDRGGAVERDPDIVPSHAGKHPVGATVGAIGGAAAGALGGIAAGPVGSLAGAVIGGLAGAMIGSGQTASGPAEVEQVPTEDGEATTGVKTVQDTAGSGDDECPRCGGTGLIGDDAQTCPLCGGRGKVLPGIGGA